MELKAGYKRTTFGIIPEDWNIVEFESVISDLKGGAPFKPTDFTNSGVMVLPKGGVGFGGILRIQEKDKQFCSSGYAIAHSRNQVDQRDTIIVLRDLVPSGPSIGLMVMIPDRQTYVLAQGVYGFRVKEQFACAGYLIQLSNTRSYRKLMNSIMVGSTQVHITNTALKKVYLPFPPIAEQTAIANALSDADALIGSLQKLIAKKRQIKQGAMQTLLNPYENGVLKAGRVKKSLGDIGEFRGGSGFPTKYQGLKDGDYPFYKVSDMNNEGNELFMSTSNHYINENVRKEIGANFFSKNTIVFAKIGAAIFLERKKILSKPSCIDNNMMGFVFDENSYDVRYLHYLFLTIKLGSLVSTTALPSLSGKEISELLFYFPTKEEQCGISKVLSDMDAEISALETKLAKYQKIKQGMMQNLLTGRIRLI